MEFNNLLLNHLKRAGFKIHFNVETSKEHSVWVCVSVSSSGSPKWCQSPLVEKLQLCVNYSGSSWVLVMSKCTMMAVYSVEETRDNIQLLMDRIKEMVPQGNTADLKKQGKSGIKGLCEFSVKFYGCQEDITWLMTPYLLSTTILRSVPSSLICWMLPKWMSLKKMRLAPFPPPPW